MKYAFFTLIAVYLITSFIGCQPKPEESDSVSSANTAEMLVAQSVAEEVERPIFSHHKKAPIAIQKFSQPKSQPNDAPAPLIDAEATEESVEQYRQAMKKMQTSSVSRDVGELQRQVERLTQENKRLKRELQQSHHNNIRANKMRISLDMQLREAIKHNHQQAKILQQLQADKTAAEKRERIAAKKLIDEKAKKQKVNE